MLARAERLCLRVAYLLAAVGLTILIGFAVATLVDGLMRSVLNSPVVAVGDVGTFVVAAAVAACFPLAQLQRANITIEFFGIATGTGAARVARAVAALLVLATLAAMTRQMFIYAAQTGAGGDTTTMLSIPTAPFWFVAAAMFACATVAQGLVAAVEIAGRRGLPTAAGGGH